MKTQTALEKILNWIEKFSTGLEILNWIGNSQLDWKFLGLEILQLDWKFSMGLEILNWIGNSQLDWKFLGLEILNWIEKFFNGIGNSQLD